MALTVPRPAAPVRLAAEAWEALFRAQVTVMRRLAADDIWGEVSMREYDVLFQLAQAPGRALRIRELNEHILLSQPSLSRLVERLEGRGLVARCQAPGDGRGVLVRLTEPGSELQREVGRRHVATIRRVVGAALAEDELRLLTDLCTRLRQAQADLPEEEDPT